MRGAKVSDEVVRRIERLWAQDTEQLAKEVLAAYIRTHGRGDVGLRKVQQLIADFKRNPSGEPVKPFLFDEWQPWRNEEDSPGSNSFLLTLDAVCLAVQIRHLYVHEAKWGMRLQVALQGLTPYDQLCFITLYAIRDVQAHYAEGKPFTADLDSILTYKPWLPESAHAYGMATTAHLAVRPAAGSRQELSVEDAVKNFFAGRAWETLRVDLRPPWFITPAGVKRGSFLEYGVSHAPSLQEWAREMKDAALQNRAHQTEDAFLQEGARMASDAALQFWMGDNPIFEKPLLHGMYGLMEPGWPDIEVPEESSTHEEAPE